MFGAALGGLGSGCGRSFGSVSFGGLRAFFFNKTFTWDGPANPKPEAPHFTSPM